jgi:hypothetical protein
MHEIPEPNTVPLIICRSVFTTLSPALLQEQPDVVLCSEGVLASWLLVRDGHDEHSGLHGLGHQSVTPYIHGRGVVLLKPSFARVCLSPRILSPATAFYRSSL